MAGLLKDGGKHFSGVDEAMGGENLLANHCKESNAIWDVGGFPQGGCHVENPNLDQEGGGDHPTAPLLQCVSGSR